MLSAQTCRRLTNDATPLDETRSSNQDVGLRDVLKDLLVQCGSVEEGCSQLQVQVKRGGVNTYYDAVDNCGRLINVGPLHVRQCL